MEFTYTETYPLLPSPHPIPLHLLRIPYSGTGWRQYSRKIKGLVPTASLHSSSRQNKLNIIPKGLFFDLKDRLPKIRPNPRFLHYHRNHWTDELDGHYFFVYWKSFQGKKRESEVSVVGM